jgi:Cd2+/Zn2+-exporting ATPase
MRVTRRRPDTTLARIIHLVEEAQTERAPAQAFVERFARVYTPAVIALAIVVAGLMPIITGTSYSEWVYRALVLLVIACPCALVISTPVSIVSALAAAARHGVLIKGGLHLEQAGSIRCLAFDKTGTLTRGVPSVVSVQGIAPADARRVLAVAAAVEAHSEHPIAGAVVRHARASGVGELPVTGYRAWPGRGGEAFVDRRSALVGSERLFRERGLLSDAVSAEMQALAAAGQTAILVAHDGVLIGLIALADRPREIGRDVVALVREQGVRHVVMLTGDNAGAAAAIGRELRISEVRPELLPEDKVAAVRDLRRQYGTTAMVGDGVNDAPALAAADLGIVMGAAGSDAALETADVALMSDDLSKIPYAIRLSRAALRNVKMNVAISLAMKAVFLVLAVTGHATLWMAIAADTGASLVVVANGLRLLRTA